MSARRRLDTDPQFPTETSYPLSLYADVRAASRPTIVFQYGNSFGGSNAVYTSSHQLPGFTHLPPGGATYAGQTRSQNYEGCHTQV